MKDEPATFRVNPLLPSRFAQVQLPPDLQDDGFDSTMQMLLDGTEPDLLA